MICAICSTPRMTAKSYIAALPPLIERCIEKDAYRTYVTDSLKLIAGNTAKYVGGKVPAKRYIDIIHPKPEETRTADEIIEQVLGGLMEK